MTNLKSLVVTATLLLASPALALVPIAEEPHINGTLLQGFIADKIADTCPSLDGRTFKALNELEKLKNYALKQGYTADEIRAFVTSKSEKARGKKQATEWLAAAGAKEGDVEAHCRVGREEMAKGSLIGSLLRED